ncbi:hypothetical protein CO675_27110 [Bradyrhizobium sp. C9]|nr:hypothetical protein CO675_27110 [Bradyrhizobium sp. C9]
MPDPIKLRNELPFFLNGTQNREPCYWNVIPSGNYSQDLKTGGEYARAFLPMLMYNGGASDLGVIVDDMAKAARKLRPDSKGRAIDAVALGFLLEIGGIIQGLIGATAISTAAIKSRDRKRCDDIVKLVESGEVFKGLHRSTLFHNPNASIFD